MEKDVNKIVGENLVKLRKSKGLTQLELAKKLKFSDKTISKWESGESLPSLEVLCNVCEFYGITLNDLTGSNFEILAGEEDDNKTNFVDARNKTIITLLGITFIWIVATVIFIYHNLYLNSNYWIIFVWAVPVSFLVAIVANAVWGKRKYGIILVSLFIWTFFASIYIHLLEYNLWMIFLLGVPLQISIILWSGLKRNKVKKK